MHPVASHDHLTSPTGESRGAPAEEAALWLANVPLAPWQKRVSSPELKKPLFVEP